MWTCPNCERSIKNPNQWHYCEKVDMDSLFEGKSDELILIFDKLLIGIVEWDNVAVSATKNCIVFVHHQTFFIVRPMKKLLDLKFYSQQELTVDSLKTPNELIEIGYKTGLDGNYLAKCSKLSAKVDNTAVQDGFQLYLHSFVVSDKGDWSVIQQGMQTNTSLARRYHWHSENIKSFVEEPHTAVCGENQGLILNLVDKNANATQNAILDIAKENPTKILKEIPYMQLPTYCGVKAKDVDLKRLGSILWLAQETETTQFEDLLLLKGLGPRTLQSLTLVSEVIHGTPSRFSDPARFTFAHGAKGGKPFPVPTQVYDEVIDTLKTAVQKAKISEPDKQNAIKKLTQIAQQAEQGFTPNDNFEALLQKENDDAWKYGGRTIKGFSKPPVNKQLNLFD